jgi:chemotaxis protein MotB
MADKKLQPIIIKRVKKTAHAHHGGAWKIAYADFVTAMMAFFLLMWLLGSTAQGELQGIAAYFNSPLKVAMSGGSGAGNSSSIVPGGGNDLSKVHGQVRRSESEDNANRRSSQAMGRAEVRTRCTASACAQGQGGQHDCQQCAPERVSLADSHGDHA